MIVKEIKNRLEKSCCSYQYKELVEYKLKLDMDQFKDVLEFNRDKNSDIITMHPKWLNPDVQDTIYMFKFFVTKPWQSCIKELAAKTLANNVVYVAGSTDKLKPKQSIKKGISIIENLLNKGVPSKNIVFEGICCGGAFATLVAKHF